VAIELFLKIDGIKGESADSKHKDEIDVESISWGLNQSTPVGGGGGGGAGKATFHDFSFIAVQSVASPLLMLSCASGKHLKEAVLTARRSGKAGLDFYKISFTDVTVSSVQESGSEGGNAITESVSFSFAKVRAEYSRVNQKGVLGPPVTFGWNVGANKKL
jgi:type VI secretion system secreted protein Hcp